MRKFGGTWSESKLDCVEEYARSYLQVMLNQSWCELHYIDAFAGSGEQALKSGPSSQGLEGILVSLSERADTEEFLVGSALRALRASASSARPFDRFLFIDADEGSCRELRELVSSDFPAASHSVDVVCDDANVQLESYLDSVKWSTTRALVFLDPYGLEVDWGLIQRLAATGACDVWYLFPLGGVIRMMTADGQMPDSWITRLDRLFGTHDWHKEFYRPSPQKSLFGADAELLLKDASTQHVVDYVQKRLSSAFAAVSDAGVLRNRKGAPLFALLMGVSNPSPPAQKAALRIANHLVKDLSKP